jgi:hypothetical protein
MNRSVRVGVIAIGLFYLVLALAGFIQTGNETSFGGGLYGGNSPDLLWGAFGVNTAMNFIHMVLGAATILAGFILDRTKVVAWCAIIGFGLVFLYGLVTILLNIGTTALAITWGDNILHLVTALVLAVIAVLTPTRSATPVR